MAWMAVEARYLYIKLVIIFDPESENFIIKYGLAAYGKLVLYLAVTLPIVAAHH